MSTKLIRDYRQFPDRYTVFVQKLIQLLFPQISTDLVDRRHVPIDWTQYRMDRTYLYDDVITQLAPRPVMQNDYLVFHTKVRMERKMDQFLAHDLPILRSFFQTFRTDKTIVLMGERTVEECYEKRVLGIISLYSEMKPLWEHNHVIDRTKEVLYSGNPDYDDFLNDLFWIHYAHLNVIFGIGGPLNLAQAFSYKLIGYVGELREYQWLTTRYRGLHQNVTQFVEQIEHLSHAQEELVILVIGCVTIPKYRDYLRKIQATWGQRAQELGVKVLYMLGDQKSQGDLGLLPTELQGEQYVYLNGVGNDYISASHKQSLGLRYIYDRYNAKFVYVCGSDTYVNVDKMLDVIRHYSYRDRLYLGGHMLFRRTIHENLRSFSGGGGFLLSYGMLSAIYHLLSKMVATWESFVTQGGNTNLITACDVCIGHYVQRMGGRLICYQNQFSGCNDQGEPKCCVGKKRPHAIVACHYMTLEDFDRFHQQLIQHHYWIERPIFGHQIVPNCTVITMGLNNQNFVVSQELMHMPCYLMIYCIQDTLKMFMDAREASGYQDLTIYHALPDLSHSVPLPPSSSPLVQKYQLIQQTLHENPFNTDRFLWIDHDLATVPTAPTVSPAFPSSVPLLTRIACDPHDHYHIYLTPQTTHCQVNPQIIQMGKASGLAVVQTIMTQNIFSNEDAIYSQLSMSQLYRSYGSSEHLVSSYLQSTPSDYELVLQTSQIASALPDLDRCHCIQFLLEDLCLKEGEVLQLLKIGYTSATRIQSIPLTKFFHDKFDQLCTENPVAARCHLVL